MKFFFTFLFFFATLSILEAQKSFESQILGGTYSMSYNKATDMFEQCQNVSTPKTCSSVFISDAKALQFVEGLKTAMEAQIKHYQFNYFGETLKYEAFDSIVFKTIDISFDHSQLKKIDQEVTLEIKDVPDDFNLRLKQIENPDANASDLKMELLSETHTFLAHEFEISKDSIDDMAIYKALIVGQLNEHKAELAAFYAKQVTAKFNDLLQQLYEHTSTPGTGYKFLTTEGLYQSKDTTETTPHDFYYLLEKEIFSLRICVASNCYTYENLPNTIAEGEFKNSVLQRYSIFDPNNELNQKTVEKIHFMLKSKIEEKRFAALSDTQKLTSQIDNAKDQYSAKVVLNEYIQFKINEESNSASQTSKKDGFTPKDSLRIIDASLRLFNNKAASIYVKAELKTNGKTETLIFYNGSYSVPLRSFNVDHHTVYTYLSDKTKITISYNDVFNYEADETFNYSVANDQFSLSNANRAENSHVHRVAQRRFFDFFTGIFYSDVLGLNSDNPNAAVNAQAKLLVPMNLRNWGKWSATRQFTTTVNLALDDTFQDDSRFIEITDTDTFSDFDLLRKNNLYSKISLDLLTYESKGWFLNTSIGYSLGFYRTAFRFTETVENSKDIVTESHLLSLGHGPYLNFEIRPQNNFGADISLSFEDLNYAGDDMIGNADMTTIINRAKKDHFIWAYNLINVEANFYWLTDPGKSSGGIYTKIGAWFHTDNNSIFPQLQVGYATNLSSFVNRFISKPDTENDAED
jgi:hypothetical protein